MAAQDRSDYDAAITLYSKAYELVPHPVLLFDIAQAHRLAGRFEHAETFYQRFLATNPTGPEAQTARDVLAELMQARLSQRPQLDPPPRPADVPRPDPPLHSDPLSSAAVVRQQVSASRSPQIAPWYTDKVGDALVTGGVLAMVVSVIVYRSAVADADASQAEKASYLKATDLVERALDKRAVSVAFAIAAGSLVAGGVVRYLVHDRTTVVPTVGIAPMRNGGVVTYWTRF